MFKMKKLLALFFLPAFLLSSCMTFNNAELPEVKPPKPEKAEIVIEKKIGKFTQKLNGQGTSRGVISNRSTANGVFNAMLGVWQSKGIIKEYDDIGDLGNVSPDYTLTLNGYRDEDMSWLGSIACGATFFIIPSSATIEFDLKFTLKDNKTGKIYIVSAKNSQTHWMEILLLLGTPVAWLGNHNMWVDTAMYVYDEFYKQGAFDEYY